LKAAYLALGSNLGDREQNLRRALELLETSDIHVLRRSSIYETEPRDVRDQPWFLNMVVEVNTGLFPMQLLARIQKIEREMHRTRTTAKGPRTIDVDILLFGKFVVDSRALQIPHPRITERRFVLEPLAELAPQLRHPSSLKPIHELLATLKGQIVRRIGPLS
jgi:2-amino-4-hydroxy-6-hydroxymethyldihydropteridine diphosphokinase